MIKAKRTFWGEQLVFRYATRLMRKHFNGVWLHGHSQLDEMLTRFDPATPLVFYSNHQSWWDGFLEIPLMRRYKTDHRLMMESENLKRFSFFRHAGIFGVDPSCPRARGASLLYTVRHLRGSSEKKRAALFIYPHGRLVPEYEDWPDFQAGLEGVFRLCPAALAVPVVKRFVFSDEPGADVFLDIGPPLDSHQRRERSDLQHLLIKVRDNQRERLLQAKYETCLKLI